MALRTNRVLMRKCAPFYSRVQRASEDGSDSEGPSIRSSHSRSSSFTWLHRACSSSNGHSSVPLSESPKRELRMRSASKVGSRHHHHHPPAKKQKKQASFSKLMWW